MGGRAPLFCAAALAAFLAAHGAVRPAPGPALAHRLASGGDVIGIVHWGLNTFTGREWGFGDEDPAMLAPARFDADAIASACAAAGMHGLVVVAKHHDGFCLWPTKTTSHNISKSPFRGGRGDYVREMSDACRRHGLKFGVYVSPWDRNSAFYGTGEYVEIYHAQLKELLGGGYGEIFEAWFDGANGGDGFYGGARERRGIAPGYYRFDEVFRFVRAMQPGIAVFCGERDDSDFRWPGNERGLLDPDSRATVVSVGGDGAASPDYRAKMNSGDPGGAFFRMCEADFPLRRGWFHRESERGTAKSAEYLAKIYLASVGNGGTMDIGVAPTKDGVLAEEDESALRRFGGIVRGLFANEVRPGEGAFNLVELREDLSNGEQIDAWRLLADGRELVSGRAVGHRRLRLLPEPVSPETLELRIDADGGSPLPVSMRLFMVEPSLARSILAASDASGETATARWMAAGKGE